MPKYQPIIHGHAKKRTQIYIAWSGMRARVLNPNTPSFKHYGGRGIKICERWNHFENFLEDMGEPEKGLTLDRIDNNQGYSFENCRWTTQREQLNNRRINRFVIHQGVRKTVGQWAQEFYLDYDSMRNRLRDGWSMEKIKTTPVNRYNKSK